MKKIIVISIILAIFLVGCASAPSSQAAFDPSVNPFIGEWIGSFNTGSIYEWAEEWNFTNDQFTVTDTRGRYETGSYSFTQNRIHFTTQTNSWSQTYRRDGELRIGLVCHV